MLVDNIKRKVLGRFKGPTLNRSILMVVTFVECHLETFAEEYRGTGLRNEKGLTQKLCILLNGIAQKKGYPFWFDKEYMEKPERGDSPTVDIGVITNRGEGVTIHSRCYSNKVSFFSMEAKRLDVITGAREKEYLVGRWENGKYKECGGVERFKKGIHGIGLDYSALIGYIQKYDIDYWHHTINSWIDEYIEVDNPANNVWSNDDKLIAIRKTAAIAKFQSKNSRKDGIIHLFHLWINLVQ